MMTLKEQQNHQDRQRIMTALVNNKGHRRASSIDLCMSERTLYRYLSRLDLKSFGKSFDN